MVAWHTSRRGTAGTSPLRPWPCLGARTPLTEELAHGWSLAVAVPGSLGWQREGCQGDLGRHCSCCHPPCMAASSARGATPPFLSSVQPKCAQPQHGGNRGSSGMARPWAPPPPPPVPSRPSPPAAAWECWGPGGGSCPLTPHPLPFPYHCGDLLDGSTRSACDFFAPVGRMCGGVGGVSKGAVKGRFGAMENPPPARPPPPRPHPAPALQLCLVAPSPVGSQLSQQS